MSNLIENPILDQHGSKPHGMRSLSPGDISPIDAITGRQKIDPRLGALAVPFLIAWGVACGEAAGGRGGTEPSTPTPIVEPTKTPTMIPTPDARATATAVAQEKLIPEIVALIGEPTGYRPATKIEIFLYEKNPTLRPTVKKDSQGDLLIPTYSDPKTILGELDRFDLKRYYSESFWGAIEPEIFRWIGQIEQARALIRIRNFPEAKKNLNWLLWEGVEKVSRGDASWFREDPKMFPSNPDKNGNGVSDWFEGVHGKAKDVIKRLGY